MKPRHAPAADAPATRGLVLWFLRYNKECQDKCYFVHESKRGRKRVR